MAEEMSERDIPDLAVEMKSTDQVTILTSGDIQIITNPEFNAIREPIKNTSVPVATTLEIHEEISAEEWKEALSYDQQRVNTLLSALLDNFAIEPNNQNIEWLYKVVSDIIQLHETKNGIKFPLEVRQMLISLAAKIAYDRLYVSIR